MNKITLQSIGERFTPMDMTQLKAIMKIHKPKGDIYELPVHWSGDEPASFIFYVSELEDVVVHDTRTSDFKVYPISIIHFLSNLSKEN